LRNNNRSELLNLNHQTFEVMTFGVIQIHRMVSPLTQAVEDSAISASFDASRSYRIGEKYIVYHL